MSDQLTRSLRECIGDCPTAPDASSLMLDEAEGALNDFESEYEDFTNYLDANADDIDEEHEELSKEHDALIKFLREDVLVNPETWKAVRHVFSPDFVSFLRSVTSLELPTIETESKPLQDVPIQRIPSSP